MEHPFTSGRFSLIIYWSILVIILALQAVFNIVFEILPVGASITDALVFSFSLGAFGLAIWYVAKYNNLEDGSPLQIISSHLVAALVFSVSWVLFSGFIAKSILQSADYAYYIGSITMGRIFAGLLFYVLLASIYYLFILFQRNRQKILHEAELQQQVRDAQLSALKSQINPHFLFNSLNSIASLTLADPPKAHEMVIALSGFMRYSLRRHNGELVTLKEDLQSIDLYLLIEKIRFGEKLDYHFDIEEECLKLELPNLILQPLFENAIKYGVYEASEPVEIKLVASRKAGFMEISISNDFDSVSFPARGEGVGLKNVQERLRIIYGSNNLLQTDNTGNRFTVTLFIPWDNK